jgi:hypothetical protein
VVVGALLRELTRTALAGVLVGIAVLGIGGRVAMRLAALVNPAATGRLTENGNVVGAITVNGTILLVLFGGLLFGLVGSIVWIIVGPWLPGRGLARAVVAAPVAVALSSFLLIAAANPDFRILDNDQLVVGLLVAILAAYGLALPLTDEWLDRRLPDASRSQPAALIAYSAAVFIGAITIFPIVIGVYLSTEQCGCGSAPVPIGMALFVAGLATVVWWYLRARGQPKPPRPLAIVGRGAVLVAVVFGALRLASDVGQIINQPA